MAPMAMCSRGLTSVVALAALLLRANAVTTPTPSLRGVAFHDSTNDVLPSLAENAPPPQDKKKLYNDKFEKREKEYTADIKTKLLAFLDEDAASPEELDGEEDSGDENERLRANDPEDLGDEDEIRSQKDWAYELDGKKKELQAGFDDDEFTEIMEESFDIYDKARREQLSLQGRDIVRVNAKALVEDWPPELTTDVDAVERSNDAFAVDLRAALGDILQQPVGTIFADDVAQQKSENTEEDESPVDGGQTKKAEFEVINEEKVRSDQTKEPKIKVIGEEAPDTEALEEAAEAPATEAPDEFTQAPVETKKERKRQKQKQRRQKKQAQKQAEKTKSFMKLYQKVLKLVDQVMMVDDDPGNKAYAMQALDSEIEAWRRDLTPDQATRLDSMVKTALRLSRRLRTCGH